MSFRNYFHQKRSPRALLYPGVLLSCSRLLLENTEYVSSALNKRGAAPPLPPVSLHWDTSMRSQLSMPLALDRLSRKGLTPEGVERVWTFRLQVEQVVETSAATWIVRARDSLLVHELARWLL